MSEPYVMSKAEEAQANYVEELYKRGAPIQARSRYSKKKWVDIEGEPVFNWKWYEYRIKVDDEPNVPQKEKEHKTYMEEHASMLDILNHILSEADTAIARNDTEDFAYFARDLIKKLFKKMKE